MGALRQSSLLESWKMSVMNLATGIFVIDHEQHITFANLSAQSILGHSGQFLQRHPLNVFFAESQHLTSVVDKLFTQQRDQYQCQLMRRDAPQHEVLLAYLTWYDELQAIVVEVMPLPQALLSQVSRESQSHTYLQLLKNLAHEIKNPLGGIRGAAQLIQQDSDDEQRELLDIVVAETDRLRRLVDRFLLPFQPKLNQQTVNIHTICESARQIILLEFKDAVIQRDYDVSLPDITVDDQQIQQILLNLLRNAAQMGQQYLQQTGQAVTIKLRTRFYPRQRIEHKDHRHVLCIQVEDNGAGIPTAIREQLFQPFVSQRQGGAGLGLSLCNQMIRQHHGSITVESIQATTTQRGQTVFSVWLPLH
jgi:two-component system nitrogen regulation sensor histidine kinase GlnL